MTISELPSGRWRLQIRRKNLRVDEVYKTEAKARRAERDYLAKGKQTRGGLAIEIAWDRYHGSLAFKQKKLSTQRSEETHIKVALRRFAGWSVDAITPEDVEALILAEMNEKKAPDTIRNEVAALSTVLGFCVERQILARNPCIGIARPSIERKPRRMAPGDEGSLMKLLNHPKLRYRSVARLCLLVRETGARPGEWSATRWNDIDLGAQKVTFPNTKYKNLPRTIPLTNAAIGLLSAQLEDVAIKNFELFGASDYVFPTLGEEGKDVPLQYSGTVRDMKEDKLLPAHFRAHSGRHEFISKLVEDSDLDDARIMSLVGHHSPTSMQIYAHARNVRYRGQLEALEQNRREERAKSFSQAAGLPSEVVVAYLEHRRKREKLDRLDDEGNELLFDGSTIDDLDHATRKLGATEPERMRTLLKMRAARLHKEGPAGKGPKKASMRSLKRRTED